MQNNFKKQHYLNEHWRQCLCICKYTYYRSRGNNPYFSYFWAKLMKFVVMNLINNMAAIKCRDFKPCHPTEHK